MSEPGDSHSCAMSAKLESLLTGRRAAVCMGGVLVAPVKLDKLPLQHLPLWFQHWSSELFDSLHSAGD